MVATEDLELIEKIISNRLIEESEVQIDSTEKVAVCTPMYNTNIDGILPEFLYHLLHLDYQKDLLSLHFTIQGNDNTIDVLRSLKSSFGDEYRKITIDRVEQKIGGDAPHVENVVNCRNVLAEEGHPHNVLFMDHDNFPPPYAIHRLQRAAKYGGDIAGAVYLHQKRNKSNPSLPMILGFTAFFRYSGKYYHLAFHRDGDLGTFYAPLLGRMVFTNAIGMGTTLVQRKVLDDVEFYVPYDTNMTDDTAFCEVAVKKGYKIIADFGLFIPHWGIIADKKWERDGVAGYDLRVERKFNDRRLKMKNDGVYFRKGT